MQPKVGCGALKYQCSCPSCAVTVTMHCDVSLRLHLPVHLTFNTTGNINSTRHVCSVQCVVVVCVVCVSLPVLRAQQRPAHHFGEPSRLAAFGHTRAPVVLHRLDHDICSVGYYSSSTLCGQCLRLHCGSQCGPIGRGRRPSLRPWFVSKPPPISSLQSPNAPENLSAPNTKYPTPATSTTTNPS